MRNGSLGDVIARLRASSVPKHRHHPTIDKIHQQQLDWALSNPQHPIARQHLKEVLPRLRDQLDTLSQVATGYYQIVAWDPTDSRGYGVQLHQTRLDIDALIAQIGLIESTLVLSTPINRW